MPKSKKAAATAADRASEIAGDLAERIAPSVEMARDKAAPLLAEAREKAAPVLADARDKAAPVLADARDKAAPVVHDARAKFTAEVLPVLTAAVVAANEATEDVREETAKRGKATVAALRGELEAPSAKKSHKLRNLLVVLGLGAVVAFVAKKMSDRPATTTWESPTPPAPPPAPATGTHRAETGAAGEEGDDTGGASPDVAAADAATAPHAATTPDNPAETIDVKRD